MADPSWWRLTFTRKKKTEAKVLYEIPAEHGSNAGNKEPPGHGHSHVHGPAPRPDAADGRLSARLEKMADKSAAKGRHVKVSHSGRFKEKKKIRATLAENPHLFPECGPGDENHKSVKQAEK